MIPADDKPFARVAAAGVLAHTLIEIDPKYPKVSKEKLADLVAAKDVLEAQAPKGAEPDPYAAEMQAKAERKRQEVRRGRAHDRVHRSGDESAARRRADVAWFALSPEEAASRQKVDPAVGLTAAEADARRADVRPEHLRRRPRRRRSSQVFTRQYADPMQIVLLIAGIICLFLPGQFYTGVFLILLTLFNAWMAMNQEGKAEASASALEKHDGRQGQGPA